MITKQLSVFLENKSGSLTEVTRVLGNAGVNLTAMSVADNSDFGILRCTVSDTALGVEALKAEGFAVMVSEVVAFSCGDVPGTLSKVLSRLSTEGVAVEYLYSFACCGKANIILRPSDMGACIRILEQEGLKAVFAE